MNTLIVQACPCRLQGADSHNNYNLHQHNSTFSNNHFSCPDHVSSSKLLLCMPTSAAAMIRLSNSKSKHTVKLYHQLAAANSSHLNTNCKLCRAYINHNYFPNHKHCNHKLLSARANYLQSNAKGPLVYGSSTNPTSGQGLLKPNLKDKSYVSTNGDGFVEWEGNILLEKLNFLDLSNIVAEIGDKVSELFGSRVYLQLVSSTSIDPATGEGRRSEKAYLEGWFQTAVTLRVDEGTNYKVHLKVDKEFGVPGSILVENQHPNPFFLHSLTLTPTSTTTTSQPIKFTCNSWIYSPTLSNGPRIFFTDQCCLPKETPVGVRSLRSLELLNKRGDGTGERVSTDRVYDYYVYNDLGNPDKGAEYARHVLGGSKDFPYPRRCRTGRASTQTDSKAESPLNLLGTIYVPRDEQFGRVKQSDFLGSAFKSLLHVVLPSIRALFNFSFTFKSFEQVYDLYSRATLASFREKIAPPTPIDLNKDAPLELFRQLTDPRGGDTTFLKFPVPQIMQVNEQVWCDDCEFARQLLVGVNPLAIQRMTEFPPSSNLDPNIYGPALSAISSKHIEGNMEGLTIDEALREKRLYALDYHDVYMPYIERVNKLKGKGYATRTIFFLARRGFLIPLAIELSLPPYSDGTPHSNEVFVPPMPGKRDPLWELAKLHVITNDTGYHELVSHWLRSHASMEPIIIATHRQLSAMHPMYGLMVPHFKNTMSINAAARKELINSFSGSLLNGGIIEYGFTPGPYSMELSSAAYKDWNFREQALPADLIKRGMAEPDSTQKHGLRLFIEDYPFAVDGLDIWAALCGWANDYVNIFYPDDASVVDDVELQEWWSEVRHKGHADKADEKWWPKLTGRAELVEVASTIMWLASGHHAGVNFGQYGYGGFPPSRPTMGRHMVPTKGSEEYRQLMKEPGKFYLESMSSVLQSVIIIATLEILSTHAVNEEYLGQASAYEGVASSKGVRAALERFRERLREADRGIHERNQDPCLVNRCGKSAILYTILLPTSPTPGLSGRGIPNSVSI